MGYPQSSKSLNFKAHKIFLTFTVRHQTPSMRNCSERKDLKGSTKVLYINTEHLYKYLCAVSSKTRFRQEAIKEASKFPQKAWQPHGKPQQVAPTKHPAQVSLLLSEQASLYCAGSFWNRV